MRPTADDPLRTDRAVLNTIVPEDPSRPYDMKEAIRRLVDDGGFFEIHAHWAQNLIVGFARLDGRVAIVARRPCWRGCWTSTAASRGRGYPLLRRVQHPAGGVGGRARLFAGGGQEHGGIIRNGAKLLFAFAEATVPKVTVITRKAYGGANRVMNPRHLRADLVVRPGPRPRLR